MIRRAFQGLFAGLMGLVATAGLPVSIDAQTGRRVAGVVRKTKRNRAGGPRGTRPHRRAYLPDRRRKSCSFVYARPRAQASAEARFRVIANNDRIENAMQQHRLEKKGLRRATG